MKTLFTSVILLLAFTVNAQYRLGFTSDEIRSQCNSCNYKDTLIKGKTELTVTTENGKVIYFFAQNEYSNATIYYIPKKYIADYIEDYNSKNKILGPNVWEQKIDIDNYVIIQLITDKSGTYFHYKFR